MEFYNSEFALVGPVILGLTIAMEEEKACGAEIDGLATVSYTHLDVYKRQVLPCCCSGC